MAKTIDWMDVAEAWGHYKSFDHQMRGVKNEDRLWDLSQAQDRAWDEWDKLKTAYESQMSDEELEAKQDAEFNATVATHESIRQEQREETYG